MKSLLWSLPFLLLFLTSASSFAYRPYTPSFVRPVREAFLNDPSKKTVCTITINSNEERNLFLQNLGKKNFNFVELLPEPVASANTPESIRIDGWLKPACETGIKCDLLVLSGEFGGTFFGVSGYKLSLEELEVRACAQDCTGILNHPREAFLFGCNTLAGSDADFRSAEEYIRVLEEHGFEHDAAVQVAEDRYSGFGTDIRGRMQNVFAGVPHLYGFNSRGPSGKTISKFLQNYFRQTDYNRRFEQIAREKPVNGSYPFNKTLATALASTAFTQCSGIDPQSPIHESQLKTCMLLEWTPIKRTLRG